MGDWQCTVCCCLEADEAVFDDDDGAESDNSTLSDSSPSLSTSLQLLMLLLSRREAEARLGGVTFAGGCGDELACVAAAMFLNISAGKAGDGGGDGSGS
jgi:hypothetical protein